MTARVLSRRLAEMRRDGLVDRLGRDREVSYRLTRQGEDAALVLLALLQYGLKHQVGPRPATRDAPNDGPSLRPPPRDAAGRAPRRRASDA